MDNEATRAEAIRVAHEIRTALSRRHSDLGRVIAWPEEMLISLTTDAGIDLVISISTPQE